MSPLDTREAGHEHYQNYSVVENGCLRQSFSMLMSPSSPSSRAPTATPAPTPTLAGVEVEVRWNGLDPAGQAAANELLHEFAQESGITIKADFADWASSYQKITTGFAAGTAPDI